MPKVHALKQNFSKETKQGKHTLGPASASQHGQQWQKVSDQGHGAIRTTDEGPSQVWSATHLFCRERKHAPHP